MINIQQIRKQFPILENEYNNQKLVYLDNGATKQKPQYVIDRINQYYQKENSNIHRGVYRLSEEISQIYENTRTTIANFIHAQHKEEIVFCPSATTATNLIASSYFEAFELKEGDEVIVSIAEHHANFVTWQQHCLKHKAKFICLPVGEKSVIEIDTLKKHLSPKTRLVAFSAMSNVLGYETDVQEMIKTIKKFNEQIICFVDAAQSIASIQTDVQKFNCDFLVFSAHKIYGPTGIGCMYGKKTLLEQMPPYQFGGDMIQEVSIEKTTFNQIPYKFEPGTPNIAGVIGLKAAIEWVEQIGINDIHEHEQMLSDYALKQLCEINEFELLGSDRLKRHSIISFNLKNLASFDVGTMLDQFAICVRTGQHCAMPLMKFYSIDTCVRLSFSVYNSTDEVDYFVSKLKEVIQFFKKFN